MRSSDEVLGAGLAAPPSFARQAAAVVLRNAHLTLRNFRLAPYSIALPQLYIGVLVALCATLPWVRYDAQPAMSAFDIVSLATAPASGEAPTAAPAPVVLGYAPNTSALVESVMRDVVNPATCVACAFAGATLVGLADDAAVNARAASVGDLAVAVTFNVSGTPAPGTAVAVSIRYPAGALPPTTSLVVTDNVPLCYTNTTSKSSSSSYASPGNCPPVEYAYSGFLDLQTDVAAALAAQLSSASPSPSKASWSALLSATESANLMGVFPLPAFASSPEYLSTMSAIYVVRRPPSRDCPRPAS